jgi:DNA (cytosine-5)-methyltransferase 1
VTATGLQAHTLTSSGADASEDGTGRGTPVIAFQPQAGGETGLAIGRTAPALVASQVAAVAYGPAVRRLTPLECERLQGLPDHWTKTSGGREQSDTARLRQIGNAVAVPVAEWITRRIAVFKVAPGHG